MLGCLGSGRIDRMQLAHLAFRKRPDWLLDHVKLRRNHSGFSQSWLGGLCPRQERRQFNQAEARKQEERECQERRTSRDEELVPNPIDKRGPGSAHFFGCPRGIPHLEQSQASACQ